MWAENRRYDLEGAFLESPIPTLILEGKWDLAFMPRKPRVFASQFPGGRLEVFEEAGHTFFEDAPREFFPVLREFLQEVEPASRRAVDRWRTEVVAGGYLEPGESGAPKQGPS